MKLGLVFSLSFCGVILSSSLEGVENPGQNAPGSNEIVCRLGEKSRTYRITNPNPYVCKLYFERNGKPVPSSRSLYHAHKQTQFCEKKVEKYVSFWESKGWECGKSDKGLAAVVPVPAVKGAREIASEERPAEMVNRAPEANRQVARTLVAYHLSQNDMKSAEKELAERLKKHPEDPEYWQMLGKVKQKKKDYPGAKVAFLKAAELSSGTEQGENLYFVAKLETESGDRVTGESTLELLKEKSEFRESAELAINELKRGKPLPPLDRQKIAAAAEEEESKNGWRLTGTVTSGYDSNVVLLPDGGTGVAPGSSFITPSVQAAYLTKMAKSPLQIYLQGGYTYNAAEVAKTYNNMPVALGAEWHLPGKLGSVHRVSVSNEVGSVFVHPDSLYLFSVADTFTLKKVVQYGKGHSLHFLIPGGYSWYPGVTAEPINVREGFNVGAGIMNQHTWEKIVFTEYFGYTHQFALGDNFKSDAYSLTVSSGRNLVANIFGNAFAGYTYTKYPRSESNREDSKYSLGGQLSRRLDFWGPMIASLGYSHERSISSVASAKYEKDIATLKVTYVME